MRKTKIIATLGPASFNLETIHQLINNGMDVARINMSHYNENAGLEKYIQCIREQAEKYKRTVAILFDLCGPKIRVTALEIIQSKLIKEIIIHWAVGIVIFP